MGTLKGDFRRRFEWGFYVGILNGDFEWGL